MSDGTLIDVSGGGGGGAPDTSGAGGQQATDTNNGGTGGGTPSGRIFEDGGERYDVPENFWDPEKNAPRVGALLKANGDLRKQISDKPKAPEKYELAVPKDLAEKIQVNPDDPLAKAAMDFAKKHGLSQDAFSELAALHFQQLAGEADQDATFQAEQSKKLDEAFGDKAKDLKAELGAWVGGLLGEDFKKSPELLAEAQMLASSASGVLLIKAIKDKLGERGIPSAREADTAAVSLSDLKTLQSSKAYNDPMHPDHDATVKKVEDGYKRLYPPKR